MSIYQKRIDELSVVERRLNDLTKSIYVDFVAANPLPRFDRRTATKQERADRRVIENDRNHQIDAKKGRYGKLLARVRAHKVLMADRAKANSMTDKMMDMLVSAKRMIDEGKMLLSFDIERSWRAETHVVTSLKAPARIVRVDDTVGFEPGHTVLFAPFGGRYVIEKVINDKHSVSSRPRGKSGEIVFETFVSVMNGRQGTVFTGRCTTREIGVTTFKNGVITSYNFRSDMADKPHWVGFQFGKTTRLSTKEMLGRLAGLATKASGYVGHSLVGDFEQVSEEGVSLPDVPIFDTFDLARILVPEFQEGGQGANLGAMCARFGVDASAPHCGGNDARYNMELLLAMINEYTKAEEPA